MPSPAELLTGIIQNREELLAQLRGIPSQSQPTNSSPQGSTQPVGNPTDPRGLQGRMSRGNNVYNSGSLTAHEGGGSQFGRPRLNQNHDLQGAIARRLGNAG